MCVCVEHTLYWQHNLVITLNIATLISKAGFLSVVFGAEEAAAAAASALSFSLDFTANVRLRLLNNSALPLPRHTMIA